MDFTIDTTAASLFQQDQPRSFATPYLPQGSLSSAALARFVAAHQRKTEELTTLFDDHLRSIRQWISEVTAADQRIAHDVAALTPKQTRAFSPDAQPPEDARRTRFLPRSWQASTTWGVQP